MMNMKGSQQEGDPPGAVTRLLRHIAEGRAEAAHELLPLIYNHLHAIAEYRMARERPGHTLQATELVHEAYLRMVGSQNIAWNDRAHFFHVAAEAMRRLLIEHARKHGRIKRGGNRLRIPLTVLDLAAEQYEEQVLALDDAMTRLDHIDHDAAEVVRLRFYAGLSLEQTADTLGVSPSTAKRDWAFARAWLQRDLMNQT